MVSKADNDSFESTSKVKNKGHAVNGADIDIALQMLKTYLDTPEINPLISALETLKSEPQNEAFHIEVINVFNDLGIMQGAVLTYAPYLNIFISDDPFGD